MAAVVNLFFISALLTISFSTSSSSSLFPCSSVSSLDASECPSNADCSSHDHRCISCQCPSNCTYGKPASAVCEVLPEVPCLGNRTFTKDFTCRYCFQSSRQDYRCDPNYKCNSVSPGDRRYYKANCTVTEEQICLGRRQFLKQELCNWTGGHKWTTALALSITLGGFGIDRYKIYKLNNCHGQEEMLIHGKNAITLLCTFWKCTRAHDWLSCFPIFIKRMF